MIIIHGENQLQSRLFLQTKIDEAKKKSFSIIRIDGRKAIPEDLIQSLEGDLFFGESKLVVIENVYSGPRSNRQDQLLKILRDTNVPVILWEPKKIDGRRLKGFDKPSQKTFSYPALVFAFLDALKPANHAKTLNLLHQTLINEPAQLVFFLLVRRIRHLLLLSALGREAKIKAAPWQKNRLAEQSKLFKTAVLLAIYQRLIQIEISQKTGRASLGLADQLDLLLLTF